MSSPKILNSAALLLTRWAVLLRYYSVIVKERPQKDQLPISTVLFPQPFADYVGARLSFEFCKVGATGRQIALYMYTVPPFSYYLLCISFPGFKKKQLCFNFPVLISVLCTVLKASVRLLQLGTGSWCPQNLGSCRANEQLLPLPGKCLITLQQHFLSLHERRR